MNMCIYCVCTLVLRLTTRSKAGIEASSLLSDQLKFVMGFRSKHGDFRREIYGDFMDVT